MYYVTCDAYVTTSLWNKVSSCYLPSWAHVVKPSSRFVLYTLDNIPPNIVTWWQQHRANVQQWLLLSSFSRRTLKNLALLPTVFTAFFKHCHSLISSLETAEQSPLSSVWNSLQFVHLRPLIWNEMSDAEAADGAPGVQALENPGFRRPQITPPKPLEVDGDRTDN